MQVELSKKEKSVLFWASFLSLAAAGFGFTFRVIEGATGYGAALNLDGHQISQIFGASLWPIAITMILFSLIVDKTGYKIPMFIACILQATSAIGTAFADSYTQLYMFAVCAGLGHGIIEAVINPACAACYPKQKTKMLTILHAAWPVGLMLAGLFIIASNAMVDGGVSWKVHSMWMLLPVVAYGLMFIPVKFPVDERVAAGVSYMEMLKQVGFLGAFLAAFMLTFEIGNQLKELAGLSLPDQWFYVSVGIGAAIALIFGIVVKSIGQPLFFVMCLLMIPIATAELGTDQQIKSMMTPVLENVKVNPSFAIVFSAFIMMIFRIFAGGVLKLASPPAVLAISGIFSAVGLLWLSGATSSAIFIAFIIYAIGQTFYWPCVLGFVAEQYPKGGALTLNMVTAIGLLSVGIIGGQLLGIRQGEATLENLEKKAPELVENGKSPKTFLWMNTEIADPEKINSELSSISSADASKGKVLETGFTEASSQAGRDVLKYAAWFPIILIVCFGAIAIWFKTKGGYKPVELETGETNGGGH